MRFWAPLAALLAAAAIVLAMPAGDVWRAGGVRLLADTDPHYHVLRAERMLHGPPGAAWRDPSLDWPNGSDVPWPPLFDAILAGAARISGAETRDEIARAAAIVPALLGLLSIALAASFARALAGRGAALATAALLAALPAHAVLALVGRVDHHIAEVLLATTIALAFSRALRSNQASRATTLVLATAIVLSFWTWPGSVLSLVAPALTVAVARIAGLDDVALRGGRILGEAAILAAAALAASIAALGPPGALGQTSVEGLGGLHVTIAAGLAGFGAIVAWRARRRAPLAARAIEIALAFAVPAALLLAVWPALREGVRGGLVALGAADPWYADIGEFRPPLFSGYVPATLELASMVRTVGLLPAAAFLAFPACRAQWRATPAARPALVHLGVWVVSSLAFALARTRFLAYFAVPAAVCAAVGLDWLSRRFATRLGRAAAAPGIAAALIAATLAPVAPGLGSLDSARVPEDWIGAVTALRAAPAPRDGRAGVAGPWSFGHLVQYYADRPPLVTPFGTVVSRNAMAEWARFLFATDEAEAEGVLRARKIGNLILRNPSHEVVSLRGYAPASTPPPLAVARDPWRGETVTAMPGFTDLVASRLYFFDGAGSSARGLEAFRLVWEGESSAPRHPLNEERIKIYELVAGARVLVTGAAPGAAATAIVDVATRSGRRFRWSTLRTVEPDGTVVLRVPYATGANGLVVASACDVHVAGEHAAVLLADDAIEAGRTVELSFGPVARAR